MENSIQTSMCKGLRASGLSKDETHEILNIVQKWYDSCGPEWTVGRIKDLRHWYETYLAGDPKVPSWYRHSRSNLPTGIWSRVFRFRNHAKALAALSVGTVIERSQQDGPSVSQTRKFLHGLNGRDGSIRDGVREIDPVPGIMAQRSGHQSTRIVERHLDPSKFSPLSLADFDKSCPVDYGRQTIRSDSKESRADAYYASLQCVPSCTSSYLVQIGRRDLTSGQMRSPQFYPDLWDIAGRIACLQQPELKARWIGNPNRVSQWAMRPLREAWDECDRLDKCTCTYDQEEGCRWAQSKLRQGISLSGTDMTSATDLLRLEDCVRLVTATYLPGLSGLPRMRYDRAVQHFIEFSRLKWRLPQRYEMGDGVKWKVGWCLGTAPSFPLLSLSNAAMARLAAYRSGLDPNSDDLFRVLGDDIIMISDIQPAYVEIVQSLGGEINMSKTLTSDRIAEFAGRLIFPDQILRKRYKLKNVSDINFMQYVSDLGPQARGLLRPRQREMWDTFKYVPGIALNGPWSHDSFGIPLEARLGWALTYSGLSFEAEDLPDPYQSTLEENLLYVQIKAGERDSLPVIRSRMPEVERSDYLSETVSDYPLKGGDPRLENLKGKTTLQWLEDAKSSPGFQPFERYGHLNAAGDSSIDVEEEPSDDDATDGTVSVDSLMEYHTAGAGSDDDIQAAQPQCSLASAVAQMRAASQKLSGDAPDQCISYTVNRDEDR